MAETRDQRIKMARRKKAQEIISATTATLGLSALATKGGAAGIKQVVQRSPKAAKYALLPKIAERADKATVPILTTGAGIGGVGGFNFAAIQREEARREREKFRRAPVAKKELTPAEKKQRTKYGVGMGAFGAVYAPAALAAMGATPSKLKERPRKASVIFRDYGGVTIDGGSKGGAAHRMAEHFKNKATAEPTLKTKDPNVKAKYEKIKTSSARETTEGAREAFGTKAKAFEAKYGMTGGAKWHHRLGAKALGTPNKATAAIYGGAAVLGAGAMGAAGVSSARAQRKQKEKLRRTVREEMAVKKSAFGIVTKVYDPEKERHKRTKGYQAAATGGAVTTGVAGAGLLGSKAAAKTQGKVSRAGFDAAKAGRIKTSAILRRTADAAGKVDSVASKVPHKGKAGTALVGTSAALAVTSNRIKAHRKGAGRSYSDWWDG